MWRLTGFADEIAPDLDVQVETLAAEGMQYLELRSVWGKNVLDLTDEEVERVRRRLDEAGIRVSSIGSPIGKVRIDDDFERHKERFERAIWCAKQFGTHYIRIFSFFMPDGAYAVHRRTVLDRLKELTDRAAREGIVLLHENEKEIYGDVPERCLDIVESVNSRHLRLVWDPANFVQCGVQYPHDAGYELLRPYLAYVHVKDAVFSTGKVVPAGEGDGQVEKTLAALHESGFEGFFSIEPHLKEAGRFSGFSGPELFRTATQAFRKLVAGVGAELQ